MNRRQFIVAGTSALSLGGKLASAAGEMPPGSVYRAWEVGPAGGFDTMRLVTRRVPDLGPDQVLVRVAVSAIAARDLAIARGWFLEDKPPGLIPLSEGVGEVLAVGSGARRVKPGERVVCGHFPTWVDGPWTTSNYAVDVGNTMDGWLTELAVLPESGLVPVPEPVSDETAATLAGSGVTAWHGLKVVTDVRKDQTVLTLGTGGVSSWGLLLAKAAGARVAITSSSDEKLQLMKELGADVTVNYRKNPEWGKVIMEQTGGADIVLENVGRTTLDQSMMAAATNAVIVMIGTGPMPDQLPRMPGLYMKNLTLKAISNGSRRMLEDMLASIAYDEVQAVIGKEFDFEDAINALEFMSRSSHAGKVIIRHPA